MKGTIKRLVADKGFGFISPEGGDKDVFFHSTGLQGVEFPSLKEGDVVTFDVVDSDKGPKAENVTLA
jgi:CspA family cold shock protein